MQPGVLLDAEWIGAKYGCFDFAKYTISRRHNCLKVLQANREISPAASRAASASIRQQTFSVLKLLQIYLEYTWWSQNLWGYKKKISAISKKDKHTQTQQNNLYRSEYRREHCENSGEANGHPLEFDVRIL